METALAVAGRIVVYGERHLGVAAVATPEHLQVAVWASSSRDSEVEVSGFEPPTSTLRRSWGSPPETAPPAKALVTALPAPLQIGASALIRWS